MYLLIYSVYWISCCTRADQTLPENARST